MAVSASHAALRTAELSLCTTRPCIDTGLSGLLIPLLKRRQNPIGVRAAEGSTRTRPDSTAEGIAEDEIFPEMIEAGRDRPLSHLIPDPRVRSKDASFENEEAKIIEILTPYEDEDMSRRICDEFLKRIYGVFKPAGVSQISSLLDKYQWNYTELILSVARRYLSDSKGSAHHDDRGYH